ncbi:MAG: CRISPR-associated protein Cas4, partial [Pusillimonas sp.]|nr:CRISPR-associated protein Cas4 [Pusillimonas sp.]
MLDDRLITLSALQHYAFCPRQCALIHNEQAWEDNWLTAQGQLLHQRVDRGEPESRKGTRYERGVLVISEELGLTGKLDLVEIDIQTGVMRPVEYKRGKSKTDNWDKIQLCAQAICLEEMKGTRIDYGALWYWHTRHREKVSIDDELRNQTRDVVTEVRQLLLSGRTPLAKLENKCKACSLRELCSPQILNNDRSKKHIENIFYSIHKE